MGPVDAPAAVPGQDDADVRMMESERSVAPKDVPNAELLARLEKLEALIAAQNREGMLNKAEPDTYLEAPLPNQPSVVASPMSPQLQKLTDDALWLERSFTGQSMLFAFPQEGSFTIHPFHMMVRKPSNVNDGDIVDSQPVIGRPLTEPTDASALIYRIRLAELCQNMLDKDRAYAFQAQPADHKFVMEMDAKFRVYLRELPDFFSMDSTNMYSLSPSDPRRDPKITIQRYTLNLLIYRHLCKLHLPFLARGSVEQAYAYSYEACMAAARMIIQTEKHLKLEDLPFSSTRLRSVIILRSVFLASIALVLNACIGRQTEDNPVNDSHLVEAWRIMDDAKDQSPIGAKLLDLSVQVLKRHTPNHPALKMFTALPVTMPMTPDSAGREEQRRNMPFQGFIPEPEASYMDQQWQALEGRMDLNTIDFDKLFYGLEAPFI
ncbi:hypothetical protein V2A60_009038 [Cordyceps javanica]